MTHMKDCPECNGQGTVTYERVVPHSCSNDEGFIEEYEADCGNCDGTGEVYDEEYEIERGDWLMHKQQDEEYDR